MNMFQLQERIKDFSKDQLVREMQQPSGAVPPFLVLSELQRRTRMEKAFQADQAQGQQSTVAQDAIAAAGVPQGGIADMAQALAPQTDMTGNTGAMPVQNMYGGGEVKRMEPGGLLRSTGNAELDEALAELERQRLRQEEVLRSLGLQGDEEGLSGVSADVGSFAPGALGSPRMPYSRQAPLSRIDPVVAAPRTAPALPSIRPTDAQPILNEPVPPAFRDIAPPATILGPEQGPNLPSMEDAARMRAINVTPGAGGFPSQRDLDMRFTQEQRDAAALAAATAGQTPDPTSILMSDGVMGPIDDRPTPIADAFRAELAGRDARAAEAARMMAINEIPEPVEPSLMDRLVNSELGRTLAAGSGVALPQMDEDPAASTSALLEDLARVLAFPTLLPEEPGMDTGTPLAVPEEGIEALLPPPAPPTPQTGGGTGGAGGGAGARATGAADADKWLALAQFGLGLMASQAPTLGGAIGEAGTMALSQLRESQKEAYERDLAERTLAVRAAGGRGSQFPAAGANLLNSQIEGLLERLADPMVTRDPNLRDNLQSQLDTLLAQQQLLQAAYLSQYGLSGALGVSAPAGDLSTVRANVSDE